MAAPPATAHVSPSRNPNTVVLATTILRTLINQLIIQNISSQVAPTPIPILLMMSVSFNSLPPRLIIASLSVLMLTGKFSYSQYIYIYTLTVFIYNSLLRLRITICMYVNFCLKIFACFHDFVCCLSA